MLEYSSSIKVEFEMKKKLKSIITNGLIFISTLTLLLSLMFVYDLYTGGFARTSDGGWYHWDDLVTDVKSLYGEEHKCTLCP